MRFNESLFRLFRAFLRFSFLKPTVRFLSINTVLNCIDCNTGKMIFNSTNKLEKLQVSKSIAFFTSAASCKMNQSSVSFSASSSGSSSFKKLSASTTLSVSALLKSFAWLGTGQWFWPLLKCYPANMFGIKIRYPQFHVFGIGEIACCFYLPDAVQYFWIKLLG